MKRTGAPEGRLISDDLHPFVYLAIIGLAVWLVLSVWVFFNSGSYNDLSDAVVTGFVIIAVAIPVIIWRVGRKDRANMPGSGDVPPLRRWMSGQFDTWTGRVSGRDAGIEILLPIAAVVFGMTALGIVLHLAVGGEL